MVFFNEAWMVFFFLHIYKCTFIILNASFGKLFFLISANVPPKTTMHRERVQKVELTNNK